MNVFDQTGKREHKFGWMNSARCDDGYAQMAPVGSFAASALGVHNMLGNVWEWVGDCWNYSYEGAPGVGSAWRSGDCDLRVLRGGSWGYVPGYVRAALRGRIGSEIRSGSIGFRVTRTLD